MNFATYRPPKPSLRIRIKRKLESLAVFGMVAGMIAGVFLAIGLAYILIWGPIILFVKWLFGL
jgi:hypothetical protein